MDGCAYARLANNCYEKMKTNTTSSSLFIPVFFILCRFSGIFFALHIFVLLLFSAMDVQNPPDEDPYIVALRKERGSRFVKDRDPSRLLEFPRTATKWRLDPIFYEREDIPEPSAVCVATQAEGPSIGLKAIVKMRME